MMSEQQGWNSKGTAKRWKSDSVEGALLFILFIEKIFDPNTFSAVEIHDHPLLPFRDYSRKNFQTYATTAANRCLKFQRTGTGLSDSFKELIKAARDQYCDLIGTLKGDVEEDNDEDYNPDEEDDIPLDSFFEEEEDLLNVSNNNFMGPTPPTARMTNSRSGANKKSASSTRTTPIPTSQSSASTCAVKKLQDPYVLPYPSNDKIFCQLPMNGNVDEDDDFKIELKQNGIQSWVRVPTELEDAYELLGEDGRLSDNRENCPHCIIFQAEIDKRLKAASLKRDDKGHLWSLEHNLPTPFDVLLKYYDKEGSEMDSFLIQTNGLGYYYVQFWLKAVPKNQGQVHRTKGRRVGKAKKVQQCKEADATDDMSIYTFETVTVEKCDNDADNADNDEDEDDKITDMEGVRISIDAEENLEEKGFDWEKGCEANNEKAEDNNKDAVIGGWSQPQVSPTFYFDTSTQSSFDDGYSQAEKERHTKYQAYETFADTQPLGWSYSGPPVEGPVVDDDWSDSL